MKSCLQCQQSFDEKSIRLKYKLVCIECSNKIKELEIKNLRYCRMCKQEKTLSEFKGTRHNCRKCNSRKDWLNGRKKGRMKQWRESHQENVILTRIKGRCKKANIPFNLEISDIKIPEFCPILGIKLQKSYIQGNPLPSSPSVDRHIPELGYIKGNISIISFRANRIKNDATFEELKKIMDYMNKNKKFL
jgi:hypothetical protein